MSTSLLATKLQPFVARAHLVARPRLIERLDAGLRGDRALLLISAPAGFGKTTLLVDWLRRQSLSLAWLSLDAGDNGPARFLSYLNAAVQKIYPEAAQGLAAALHAASLPQIEPLLTTLVHEIGSSTQTGVLIFDDYHAIESPVVHEAVAFLIDHLPPQVHVIIAGRTDPPLPLSQLRAHDRLIELRAADLSFTLAEATAFLNEVMKLDLAEADVLALAERTEGWIVGLQLAALSLQGREDRSGFVQAFSGSHRFVLDYLIEEVLDRQPVELQSFLLQTSVLDQMTAPLCNALTGRSDGQAILQHLEQANLFVVPLDDERRWYRYHHLFSDLLRARLIQTRPDLVPVLQRRASEWYAQNDLIAEAMHAAVAAGDVDQVAHLAEENVIAMMDHGELSKLVSWMNAVPVEVRRVRPWLCVAHAWVSVYTGQMMAVEPCLQEAERVLRDSAVDHDGDARLAGHIAAIRSYVALLRGNDTAVELACDALLNLRDNDFMARGFALRVLGLAYRHDGDLETALKFLQESNEMNLTAGDSHLAMTVLHDLAYTQFLHGELSLAMSTCQTALHLAEEHRRRGGGQLPAMGYIYGLLGRLLCEQNDLETARQYARTGVALSRQWELTEVLADCYQHLAVVLQTCGDLDSALDATRAARQTARRLSDWYVAAFEPREARIQLAYGDVAAAARWAAAQQGMTDFGGNSHAMVKGLTLARVFIAQRRYGEALSVLVQVLQASQIVQVINHVLEALVLQALVFQALHKIDLAVSTLERALRLGEPQGYIRTFIDEGVPMGDLLRLVAARGHYIDYVNRLLTALQADQNRQAAQLPPTAPSPQPLIEPLTDRELEVLRLVSISQSNKAIAQTLVISIETVKKHLKNIYGKLDVHSRVEAVHRARELSLL